MNWAIVREKSFDNKVQQYCHSFERMHDFDLAIDEALSRKPKEFHHLYDHHYLWVTEKIIKGLPEFKIYYQIDEENRKVLLIEIEEA